MVEGMFKESLSLEKGQSINKPLVARLRSQMLRKGFNPKTLAERASVGRSFVYDILNGKSTNPTGSKLSAIADALGTSMQYLLTGVHSGFDNMLGQSTDLAEIAALEVEPTLGGYAVVTVDGKDKPIYFRTSWIKEELQAKPEDLRAVFVRGDSMAPILSEGDMLLINITKSTPNPPGVFLLFDGAGLVTKRLEMITQGRINVSSDNRQYAAYERNLEDLYIIGKVVWLSRKI